MILVATITLVISYMLFTAVVYNQTLSILTKELEQEAEYIKAAITISGEEYLKEMDEAGSETRVTLINRDGSVIYDSFQDQETLENHKGRKEVKEAIQTGRGKDIRMSNSVGKEMYYYALAVGNGEVIRVSKPMNNVWATAFRVLPFMLGIGIAMAFVTWRLAKQQVATLIRPINTLDLEHPLENDMYEELEPLLNRIDRQNKEKAMMEQMRKEFSANVSHELKTPLTSISGYAEIMMNGLVAQEKIPEFSKRIYDEASRMITLVGDIIKISRLDEGRIELEKEEVDLYRLTREIISRLAIPAQKRNIQVELVGEPVVYCGIRQILEEIIYNIVENAIKYNREDGTVSIWVGETLHGKKVIVRDTGIGIPKEHHSRIFERFYRVDKSHSRATGGTGLGLSIVKHGVMIHDAQIEVESEENKGTKISLTF